MNDSLTQTRWRSFENRDKAADGRFVVAVRSTKIYCRPSCPAKRPKPENVSFFGTPNDARAGGYRACLRCKPDESSSHKDRTLVAQICARIDTAEKAQRLRDLAATAGISASHLQRLFKSSLGITPKEYASTRRVQRLKERLKAGGSVTNALYDAGYGSSSRLYENGSARLGMTPDTVRRAGDGTQMAFTIVKTTLGRMLVACTPRGVSEIRFADSQSALEKSLRADYHAAHINRDDRRLRPIVQQIVAHLERGAALPQLAFDVRATAFQHKVWKALSAIPYGQTRTYGQIAASIRAPSAARAVGRACGANRVAVLIPCHRAVGGTAASGGYRWGMQRKQALLRREQQVTLRTKKQSG
ncbi:MAG: methylated-DNA--[protein]-cysteine S-methyltransferase [Candidatus Eremiobacteraeota bacterium]|nr:methylated-DNA--[protein]-cysteine S-methyltransferase [Candidatus Eremiobacteraeota bacterium]